MWMLNRTRLLAEGLGRDYVDEYQAWRDSAGPEAAIAVERIADAGEDAMRKLLLPHLSRP